MSTTEYGALQFQIKDADGNPHEYIVGRHDADQGLRICFILMGHAAGALVPLLEPLLSGKTSLASVMGGKADDAFEGVDLSKAAAEVKALLLDPSSIQLVRDIMVETTRDGKVLRNPAAFNEAYGANYGELLKALWKVVQHNRFFPLSATS